MIPQLSAETWLIGFLIIAIADVIRGMVRISRRQSEQIEVLNADFLPEHEANIFAKLDALSAPTRVELRRLMVAEIEMHQMDISARGELEKAGLVTPPWAYTDAFFIERNIPMVKRWLKKNSA